MSPEAKSAYLLVLAAVAISVAIGLLPILWCREQVKKELHERGFRPIHVRWRPFAYWGITNGGGFEVIYSDAMGCRHTVRCEVRYNRVRWVSSEVGYLLRDMPVIGRIVYLLICLFLFQLGLRGVLEGGLALPSRYAYHPDIHLRGWPLHLLCAGAFCGAASILTVLIYQYFSPDRERSFTSVARGFSILSWMLVLASFAIYAWQRWQVLPK